MSVIIGYGNLIDSATLTSTGTFEALLPLANVQDAMLANVAQTTTDAAFSITATWAAVKSVGVVALDNHNISLTGTARIECYDGVTLKDDSGLVRVKEGRFFGYVLPSVQSIDKVVITIDSTSNAGNYIRMGRIFVGDVLAPKSIPYENLTQSITDMSEITSTPSGVNFAYEYPTLRGAALAWRVMTETELLTLLDIQRTHGKTKEVVFMRKRPTYTVDDGELIQDKLSAYLSFMGNAVELTPLSNPFFGYYAGGLGIREVAI